MTRQQTGPAAGSLWVPQQENAVVEAELTPDPTFGNQVVLHGPQSPETAPKPVGVVGTPAISEITSSSSITVMSLHGGSGATTLASLLGDDAFESGQGWPVYAGWLRPRPQLHVIAVARTHHVGLRAATALAHSWAAGALEGAQLVGLVFIDDAPRLLKDQENAIRRVAHMVPNCWHISWHETWRLERPTLQSSSARVRRIVKSIQTETRKAKTR